MMCLPCKIYINEEFARAARGAEILRQLAERLEAGEQFPLEDDEDLYLLAKAEVEAIEAKRCYAVAMAKKAGAADRWVRLVELV